MQQHVRDYTELCLKDQNGMYTVQVDAVGMNINDLIEQVIKPTLLASGYQQETVEEVLGEIPPVVEPCPYKPELEKILDALHANNAEEAVLTINDLKGLSGGYYAYKSELRDLLGISGNQSSFEHIRNLKKRAEFCDHLAEDIDASNLHEHSSAIIFRDGKAFKVERIK